ncbi:MAG TPA: helix-turn-helix domain-containing protein [Solirubrobacteraceae bacterium]|nr:helix-turn-helix domain-containing protein [Solirubrobacteraceae bacterium]
MARRVFSTDAILDAARGVVLERGPRGATVDAIAGAAGVPVGSIYHRFSSVEELLAAVWLRAVRRNQDRARAIPASLEEPLQSAVEIALAMYDHCLAEREDTLLLDVLRRSDLLALDVGALGAELETANDEILALMGALARALFGRADARGRDLVLLALVDLPHGFAHRQLISGASTPARRARLPGAVRAVLAPG